MTEEELAHLHRQLPSLPVGWEPAVADLIEEVRRLRGHLQAIGGIFEELRCSLDKRESEIARTALRITWRLNDELVRALPPEPAAAPSAAPGAEQ